MSRMIRPFVAMLMAALLVAMLAGTALADERDFDLVNNTSRDLHSVYVESSANPDWGDDIMGQDILPVGQTVHIVFSKFDGTSCLYDIKVVTADGVEGTLYQVNLCEVSTVTFSDS